MSRALKLGFTAALDCINQQPALIPEGIILGTGKGSMTDTEQFLHSIKNYHETALNPTHFIHSTYNQVNGLIALNRKINSYNVTYVHRGFSFEHALLDAQMLLHEGEAHTALAGSFDEMTQEHFDVKQQWGYWKKENIHSHQLLQTQTAGTIAGEGAAFFLLSSQAPAKQAISIQAIHTLYKPTASVLEAEIQLLLSQQQLQASDIDAIVLGDNGDANLSAPYDYVRSVFSTAHHLAFKHLCGEYDTASSFGIWLCHQLLLQQHIPAYLYHPSAPLAPSTKPLKKILFYNNYFSQNQSIILMQLD
jgi:3-oxoacyl-(acyl-carrier-protein) synthase